MASRSVQLAAVMLAAGLVIGCGEKRETLTLPATPSPLVVSLDGPPGAVVAPLYAAGALGDFSRAGLAVRVEQSADGTQALAKLASGAVDLAVASEPELLLARARGEQLVTIGALAQGPLASLISIPPKLIAAVSALAGKTVATDGTALSAAELDTMLQSAGVQATSVRRINASGSLAGPLKSHMADASLGVQWNTGAVELALQHHQPTVIRIENAGVPIFNQDILVVRLAEARDRGALVRTFLQALTQAVHAEQANPATAVNALLSGTPGLNQHFETASLVATLPALRPPASGSPVGYQDPVAWRTFASWMLKNGLLGVRSDAALAVDNEFLPGQGE